MTNQPDNTQVDDEFPAYGKPWPIQCDKCEILKNKPNFPLDALPTQHYMYHVPSKWSGTDNTQELDEILEQAFLDGASDTMWQDERHVEIFATAKQAILNWHNKQVKNAVVTAEDNLDQYWNKELDKQVAKATEAIKYMIAVWDEVQGNWRETPDHVQRKFLEAEAELKEEK